MPWKVRDVVNERMSFVVRLKAGERMWDVCRDFGISRKTGYKIWKRFLEHGPEALYDQPRRPERCANRTPAPIQELVLALKKEYPTWGPKKLKVELERRHAGLRIPAASTIGELLGKHGLVNRRRRRRRAASYSTDLRRTESPNELWSADYKGEIRLGNQRYCYPLTISDHHSRFSLGCEGLESTKGLGARAVFEAVFRRWGLPEAIRTDNGSPFASVGLLGLSRLSVWWLRLGIDLERIEPGHPEQNGRHERFHLTLKQETARPAGANHLQQQERFDSFRKEYNERRPHEALGMRRPADVYRPSARQYPEKLPEPEYRLYDLVRRVRSCGHLNLRGRGTSFYLSSALAGERVGLREVQDGRWLVAFLHLELGYYDERTCRFKSH